MDYNFDNRHINVILLIRSGRIFQPKTYMLKNKTASSESASWGRLWRSTIIVAFVMIGFSFINVSKAEAASFTVTAETQYSLRAPGTVSPPDPVPVIGYRIYTVTDTATQQPIPGALVKLTDTNGSLAINYYANSGVTGEWYEMETESNGKAVFSLFDNRIPARDLTNNLHDLSVEVTYNSEVVTFTDQYESYLGNYMYTSGPFADWVEWPTPPVCNDGFFQPGEQCEDGNLNNGDGCNAYCMLEDLLCPSGQSSDADPYGIYDSYIREFSVDNDTPNAGDTITFTIRTNLARTWSIFNSGDGGPTGSTMIDSGMTSDPGFSCSGYGVCDGTVTYTVPDAEEHVYFLSVQPWTGVSPPKRSINDCWPRKSLKINEGVSCSITLTPPAVGLGEYSYVEWTSNLANSCAASWDGSITATSGNDSLTPVVTTPLSMSCTGPLGTAICDATLVFENERPVNAYLKIDGVNVTPGSPPPVHMGKEPTLGGGLPIGVHRIETAHGDLDNNNDIADNDLAFAYMYLNSTGIAVPDATLGYLVAAYDLDQEVFYLADLDCVRTVGTIDCWDVAPPSGLTVPGVNGYVTMYGQGYNGNAGVKYIDSGDPAATYIPALQVKTGETYANKNLIEITWYVRLQNWNENVTANLAIMDNSGASQY
jgi:cysteine-rich repeat protein